MYRFFAMVFVVLSIWAGEVVGDTGASRFGLTIAFFFLCLHKLEKIEEKISK